jgi:Kef-type K+ transport system membrane component KefB
MSFATLALLVGVGLLGPLLAAVPRVGPPLVVGEIAAGVLIGRSGLNLVDVGDPALTLLSDIGFALLMLIVGTHLPIRRPELRPALAEAAGLTVAGGAAAVILGYVLVPVTGLHQPLVLAVLLATSSAAVSLPVIQSLGEQTGDLLVGTAWIAMADVSTVLAIPLVVRQGSVGSVLLGIAEVLALAGLLYAAARYFGGRPFPRRVRGRSRDQHWALDLRVSLLILFVLAWLAVRQHTSILIAGFVAGAVLALLGEPRRLAEQLIGLGEGFLVPLFFVSLGARLDLGALFGTPDNLVLAAVLAVGATGVHLAAALVFRLPPAVGLLATAQLGVPSAIVSVGLGSGLLRPGQGAALLTAVLTSLGICAAGAAMLGHRDPLGDHTAPRIGGGVAPRPPGRRRPAGGDQPGEIHPGG